MSMLELFSSESSQSLLPDVSNPDNLSSLLLSAGGSDANDITPATVPSTESSSNDSLLVTSTNLAVAEAATDTDLTGDERRSRVNPAPITLNAGQNLSGINFGNTQLGSISGLKFNDTNRNATLDTGESGLSGWTIFIDSNGNGTLDTTEASAVTAANGSYTFTDIPPGNYTVREVQQAGWTQTTTNPGPVAVAGGSNITGINFGNTQFGTITGIKFNDPNANAVFDNGETPLAGWTIFIDTNSNGALDTGEATAVTGENGRYTFANVAPGNYVIREVQQTGWTQTTPNPGSVGVTGGSNVIVNFGNRQLGSISGAKFNDPNANGVFDTGETFLEGWTIFVDANRNGRLDSGEPTSITNANGRYGFTGLAAGEYVIREVQQTGWTQTTPNPGAVTVNSGENVTGINFGNGLFGSISGLKFQDSNTNGQLDGAETPLEGWTIFLDLNGNGSLETTEPSTVTGTNGTYSFTNIAPGNYAVREVQQTGWTQTTPNPGTVNVTGGSNITGINFGNTQFSSVSGIKFNDTNANGTFDTGETPLAGWTIFIDVNNNTRVDSGEPTTVTGTDGRYTFTGLQAGNYIIREVQQPGWTQTVPPAA